MRRPLHEWRYEKYGVVFVLVQRFEMTEVGRQEMIEAGET